MKHYLFAIVTCALTFTTLRAQETVPPTDVDATLRNKPLEWNDPKWWDLMEPRTPGLKIGGSDFVIDGLGVEPFRRSRATGKRTLREKFFGLPFVNPIAPKAQAGGMRRENYFAWGERDTAWSVLADRPIPGPQSVLVTVSR